MADERGVYSSRPGADPDRPRRLPRRADDAAPLRRALPPRAQRRRARPHEARLPRRPRRHARGRGAGLLHPAIAGYGSHRIPYYSAEANVRDITAGFEAITSYLGPAATRRRVLSRPAALPAAARHGRRAGDGAGPLRRAGLGHRLLRQRRTPASRRWAGWTSARACCGPTGRAAHTCCSSTPRSRTRRSAPTSIPGEPGPWKPPLSVRRRFMRLALDPHLREHSLLTYGDDFEKACNNGWFEPVPDLREKWAAFIGWVAAHRTWLHVVTTADLDPDRDTVGTIDVLASIDATLDPGGLATVDLDGNRFHYDTWERRWRDTPAFWLGDTLGGITDRVENALRLWPDEYRDQLYETAWLAFLMAQHENAWNMQALEGDDPNAKATGDPEEFTIVEGLQVRNALVWLAASVWAAWAADAPAGAGVRRRRAGARRARRAAAGGRAGPAALGRRPEPDDRALQPGRAGRDRPQRRAGHPRLRAARRGAAHGQRHVQELPVPRRLRRRLRRARPAEHRVDAQPPLHRHRRRPAHPAPRGLDLLAAGARGRRGHGNRVADRAGQLQRLLLCGGRRRGALHLRARLGTLRHLRGGAHRPVASRRPGPPHGHDRPHDVARGHDVQQVVHPGRDHAAGGLHRGGARAPRRQRAVRRPVGGRARGCSAHAFGRRRRGHDRDQRWRRRAPHHRAGLRAHADEPRRDRRPGGRRGARHRVPHAAPGADRSAAGARHRPRVRATRSTCGPDPGRIRAMDDPRSDVARLRQGVVTRSISPENPTGAAGARRAGHRGHRRRRRPRPRAGLEGVAEHRDPGAHDRRPRRRRRPGPDHPHLAHHPPRPLAHAAAARPLGRRGGARDRGAGRRPLRPGLGPVRPALVVDGRGQPARRAQLLLADAVPGGRPPDADQPVGVTRPSCTSR